MAAITGIIVFLGCYIYCLATYGFLFGWGLGWLPSGIAAGLSVLLARVTWPVVMVAVALGLFWVVVSQDTPLSPVEFKQRQVVTAGDRTGHEPSQMRESHDFESPLPRVPQTAYTDQAPPAESSAQSAQYVDTASTESLYQMAIAYRNGRGSAQDDHKALALFQQAAHDGHGGAQYYLGLMYGQGRSIPFDQEAAVSWYEKAARQNVVDAQYLLCLSYALGRGTVKDAVMAYAWGTVAKRQGSREGHEAVATIRKFLPPDKMKTAMKMVRNLTQEIGERPPVFLSNGEMPHRHDSETPEIAPKFRLSYGRSLSDQKPPAQTRTCSFPASASSVVLAFASNKVVMHTPRAAA